MFKKNKYHAILYRARLLKFRLRKLARWKTRCSDRLHGVCTPLEYGPRVVYTIYRMLSSAVLRRPFGAFCAGKFNVVESFFRVSRERRRLCGRSPTQRYNNNNLLVRNRRLVVPGRKASRFNCVLKAATYVCSRNVQIDGKKKMRRVIVLLLFVMLKLCITLSTTRDSWFFSKHVSLSKMNHILLGLSLY